MVNRKKVATDVSFIISNIEKIDSCREDNLYEVSMADDIDTLFIWQSPLDNSSHKFHLRIYWITWEKAIVIIRKVDHLADNQLFKTPQELVQCVCQIYQLRTEKIMWLEHHVSTQSNDIDTYLQTIFFNGETIQYQLESQKLETLIGKRL